MDPTRLIMRMAQLARNPPKGPRLYIMLAMLALSLALVGIEKVFGTPEWMKIERGRPIR